MQWTAGKGVLPVGTVMAGNEQQNNSNALDLSASLSRALEDMGSRFAKKPAARGRGI